MAKATFPDKELSVKARMDARRGLPSGPHQLDALKKAAQLCDAANACHQLFSAGRAGPTDDGRS